MKPDTKTVGKRLRAAAREEMADLRAELDDFIHSVPTLSQTELNQAKEKLLQRLASTTNRAASPFRADVRKKNNLNKIPYGIVIALGVAALLTILRPAAPLEFKRGRDAVGRGRRCRHIHNEKDCNKTPPCAWCPESYGYLGEGSGGPAKCYDSAQPGLCPNRVG